MIISLFYGFRCYIYATYEYCSVVNFVTFIDDKGAVAQLGERLTGSQEVVGSIPSGSTNQIFNHISIINHKIDLELNDE
tara:strand:+ start:966 stop:1202 length:237 start_codon:yes stop_codon:yes gene_type:complete